MSGKVDMRTAVTALKEEAFDFLSKPINSQDLLTTIKMALSSTKSEDTTETNANDSGKLVGPLYIRHQSGVAIVSFIRPLDQFSVQAYENAVKKLTEDGDLSGGVVLVLKDVTYINNIGLNFLLDISNRWKAANHKICFTQLSDPVQRYLRMLGYAEYFPIAFTLDEAVQLVS
ncbi:MAG: STAS domain-containing protein [Spirochaetia bacterium]|nr:STAS domain-containing protein [Spirochaetia bacterium]